MYTTEYFINKFRNIPFGDFCIKKIQDDKCKDALGHCGVVDNNGQFYELTDEAKGLNVLFLLHIYPILKEKNIHYNALLLAQGCLITYVNDGDEICRVLNISHKLAKGRILNALILIKRMQNAHEVLVQILEDEVDAEDADFEIID